MIKVEHNIQTGEIKEIEMTAKEIKEIEKMQAEAAKYEAKAKADAEAKAALLARLGLTEDELKTILG
jgi:hypothetical protein